jgi:hypothetical protein
LVRIASRQHHTQFQLLAFARLVDQGLDTLLKQ